MNCTANPGPGKGGLSDPSHRPRHEADTANPSNTHSMRRAGGEEYKSVAAYLRLRPRRALGHHRPDDLTKAGPARHDACGSAPSVCRSTWDGVSTRSVDPDSLREPTTPLPPVLATAMLRATVPHGEFTLRSCVSEPTLDSEEQIGYFHPGIYGWFPWKGHPRCPHRIRSPLTDPESFPLKP